jgi:ribosomal protein L22
MVASAVPAKPSNSRRHRVPLPFQFSRKVDLRYFIGRWPEKSVKFITRLLKNAESNADAKSLELESLVIKNIVVQQAPVRSSSSSASPKLHLS